MFRGVITSLSSDWSAGLGINMSSLVHSRLPRNSLLGGSCVIECGCVPIGDKEIFQLPLH